MRLTVRLFASGATLAMLASAPADALVRVMIGGDYTASFVLPSRPAPPSDFVGDGFYFSLANVAGTFGGARETADLTFFNGGVTGGLLISRRRSADPDAFVDYLFDASDAQLYSGTETSPIFLPGSFRLTGLDPSGDFTVTIDAVPEPAAWVTMVARFGLAGGALRYRRGRLRVRIRG